MNPEPVGTDHVYSVPAGITPLTTSAGVIPKVTPLQVTVVIAVIFALGLMVTVTVKVLPAPQSTVIGVTI